MHFKTTAIGMPTNPIPMLSNHRSRSRGTVLAKVPRNSTMMIWKTIVANMTPMNIQLLNIPRKMFIFSISRLFTSLNTYKSEHDPLI
ncbi:hypothetical protein Hanom_Chr10g00906611 [Helianthus anomalus]